MIEPLHIDITRFDRGVHGVGMQATLCIAVITRVEMGVEHDLDAQAFAARQSRHEIWQRVYGGLHKHFLECSVRAGRERGKFEEGSAWAAAAAKLKDLDV
jgi:hypothetical protein